MVEAIISGNGNSYSDGLERLYIHFRKKDQHGFPMGDGDQTAVQLVVKGEIYSGLLNAREKYAYLFMSPE